MKATFAAGCFWGVEAAFRSVTGVTATRVGFTGGHTTAPTYREVCGRATGHAEAVEVEFNPTQVSYEDLLGVFWSMHNRPPRTGSRARSIAQACSFMTRSSGAGQRHRRNLCSPDSPPPSSPRSRRLRSSGLPRTTTSITTRSMGWPRPATRSPKRVGSAPPMPSHASGRILRQAAEGVQDPIDVGFG